MRIDGYVIAPGHEAEVRAAARRRDRSKGWFIAGCAVSVPLIVIAIVVSQSLLPATIAPGTRISSVVVAVVWPPLLCFWLWRGVTHPAERAWTALMRDPAVATSEYLLRDNYGIIASALTPEETTEVLDLDARAQDLRKDADAAGSLAGIEARLYALGRATTDRVQPS